ncbi:leucyl aminopeptidase [Paenibacillus sp. 481]|nr:leucyl aminopeptidase [Paenibacillus sp. 481]UHA76126.1 leucyl aminopeptidase [Paenibacillus sp. 481]
MILTNVNWMNETNISVLAGDAVQAEADAVVVIATKKQWEQGTHVVPGAKLVQQAVQCGLFDGIKTQSFPTGSDKAPVLIAVGHSNDVLTIADIRIMMVQAAKEALKARAKRVAIVVPQQSDSMKFTGSLAEAGHAIIEGFLLGAYQRVTYKRDAKPPHGFEQLTVYGADDALEQVEQGATRGKAYALGTTLARDLTNLPGNVLYPSKMAEVAQDLAHTFGFEVHILDEHQAEAKGMGGLIGVGKGSVNPPRMIVLKYQGKEEWNDVYGLVGKGITFDTGGISIKPSANMEQMICDMGGAGTMLGAMVTIGHLRPKANVLCVIASAENMPAGNALKPGDVITSYSGRTIEVINTDAEGRLVLADAMTYAKELGATKLIDAATLTGAVTVALGDFTTGVVTNDEALMQQLTTASKRTGEYVWQLPSHQEYWDLLKSEVADVRNSCGRAGGTITAGLFVGTFADGLPWVHLDIAATAFLNKARGVDPKGGTGAMVRTIAEMITSEA